MPRGYSVSIGFNTRPGQAPGVPAVSSSETDAAAYADLFGGNGYAADLFVGEGASRWAVLARLHAIARTAAAGDVVAVTFSGAGGQRWSKPRAETFWQCCDGPLTSTDLRRTWSAFRSGVRILIIDDCCYAPVADRDAQTHDEHVRYVATQPAVGERSLDSIQGAAASCTSDMAATVLCLTACSCPESEWDGCLGGLFTEALLRTWNRGGFRGSYDTFCKRIRQALRGLQTPELVAVGPQARQFEMQRPFAIDSTTSEALSWLAGSGSSRSYCITGTRTASRGS